MKASIEGQLAPGKYNVRFISSTQLQSQLINEQFKRFKQTGKKEKLMDIACEWLEEKAKEENTKLS